MRDTVETKVWGGIVGEIGVNTAEQLNADGGSLKKSDLLLLSEAFLLEITLRARQGVRL
jgi:hypothetical protein